ncbi:MAG: hypothetical protein R2799_10110 [Crocinitomicaceae bacterium]
MKLLRILFLAIIGSFSILSYGQNVYSWTPGVNPGWTSSDNVLRWRGGCSAVTTNCNNSYSSFTDSYYTSGPIDLTCSNASTVIPTIDIAGESEYGYDFLYLYYSYDGVNWINILGAGVGLTGNAGAGVTWSYPAITTGTTVYFMFNFQSDYSVVYSGFKLTNFTVDCNVVLPIELTEFKAEKKEGQNLISWTTASEINNSHFNLERTSDGTSFQMVKVVEGIGNSSQELHYNVLDQDYERGVINYYRLTQIDFDGKKETFDLISVDNKETEIHVLRTVNLLGQPVNELYKGIVIDYKSDGSTTKRFQ